MLSDDLARFILLRQARLRSHTSLDFAAQLLLYVPHVLVLAISEGRVRPFSVCPVLMRSAHSELPR